MIEGMTVISDGTHIDNIIFNYVNERSLDFGDHYFTWTYGKDNLVELDITEFISVYEKIIKLDLTQMRQAEESRRLEKMEE